MHLLAALRITLAAFTTQCFQAYVKGVQEKIKSKSSRGNAAFQLGLTKPFFRRNVSAEIHSPIYDAGWRRGIVAVQINRVSL
jgi:hypothetical protein